MEEKRRRTGGRAGRQRAPRDTGSQAPYVVRKISTFDPFDDDQLTLIENNSARVLDEVGLEFIDDPEVLDIWQKAGARVEGTRVRFPHGMLTEIVRNNAPQQFTQHARNPARSVVIGGDNVVLVPAYGPPFVRDYEGGRRYAKLEDFENFVKLAYMAPSLHHSGGTVCEPVDISVNKRHLHMVAAHIRHSDKPFMGSVTAPERAEDSVRMAELVFGRDFVHENCVLINLINVNSPMVYDAMMVGALKVYARAGQACVVSPFILAGAMSPVSVVGTLTQIYAEALAGIALTQLLRPGAPVVFGTFASSISMQSGAPTFGTPEPTLVLYGAAQLARRLGVPFRSGGGLCASKVPDAQAGFEAANTLQTAAYGGVNFMLHTAGWLEGGLVMSYEKFMMDVDQAAMIVKLLEGADFSENGQALDAIQEVGPGNHYLGCAHTRANFETAFQRSLLADNNSFEQWLEDGSQTMEQRAHSLWQSWLKDYTAPALDDGIAEAIREYIAKREAELPDGIGT